MTPRAGTVFKIIFLTPMAVALAKTNFLVPERATAQTPPDDAKELCIDGLLYTDIRDDGTIYGSRTDVSQLAAATACRDVTTKQQAESVRKCVNGLLYADIRADGTGYGSRTDVSDQAAAIPC